MTLQWQKNSGLCERSVKRLVSSPKWNAIQFESNIVLLGLGPPLERCVETETY